MKHYFRFAPPLIITEAEIKDIVGRMDIAIKRAMDGFPKDVDVRESQLAVDRRPTDRGRVMRGCTASARARVILHLVSAGSLSVAAPEPR